MKITGFSEIGKFTKKVHKRPNLFADHPKNTKQLVFSRGVLQVAEWVLKEDSREKGEAPEGVPEVHGFKSRHLHILQILSIKGTM